MKTSDIKRLGEAWASVTSKKEDLEEAKKLDPVNDAENDKKFKDRKDKDIDNDGDVDSSDEYLHKKRAATDDAIDGGKKPAKNMKKESEDEEGEEKKKKPFPPKKDGEEKDAEDNGDESEEDEEEKEMPKVAGKKDNKKKVAQSPKTAEISKIGEATEELLSMLESAAKQQKSNATKPEGIMDKESPKSKEFADAHKKSEKKYEDDEEDGHDVTFKAQGGTKPKSGKRPQDNAAGDNKIVKSTEAPVKEDIDVSMEEGSVSLVDMARKQLAGEMKSEKEKSAYDGRLKSAKEFLERMAKRKGYVKKED